MKRLLQWIDNQAALPDILLGLMAVVVIYALLVVYDMTWGNKR